MFSPKLPISEGECLDESAGFIKLQIVMALRGFKENFDLGSSISDC
jgi:hypothetical protein